MNKIIKVATVCASILPTMTKHASASQDYGQIGGIYSQNFDSLSSTGITNSWLNDSTLPGWSVFHSLNESTAGHVVGRDVTSTWTASTNYVASNGSPNTAHLYSYGTTNDSERALGTLAAGIVNVGDFSRAFVLRNTTGWLLNKFVLSYTGEQWCDGGNLNLAHHSLLFDFAVFSTEPTIAELNGGNTAGYTSVASLNFTGPKATNVFGRLDGNAAENRIAITNGPGGQNLNWTPGSYLALRWFDDDDAGSDHGLAIDDLTFSAVPEPATLALAALSGTALIRRRREDHADA